MLLLRNLGRRFALLGGLLVLATPGYGSLCANGDLEYVQTGDGTDPGQACSIVDSCKKPEFTTGVTYNVESGCTPLLGPCSATADFSVTFPGNRLNDEADCGFACTFAQVELYDASGSFVDQCGSGFNPIQQDNGDVTVNWSVSCDDPVSAKPTVDLVACDTVSGCRKVNSKTLDFHAGADCPIPPKFHGCGDGQDSAGAEMCCFGPGGANAPDGTPPGFPLGDTNAQFFYQAGGVGKSGTPGATDWITNTGLGRYWTHEFATRIEIDSAASPPESHVYLIDIDGTFSELTDTNGDDLYDEAVPSDEYRTLEFNQPAAGEWTLTGLDGTVTVFNADGSFQQRSDRLGNAWTATYSGGLLDTVTFPDGREEVFTYASGRLQQIQQVGLDDDGTLPAGDPADCSSGTECRTWAFTWSGDDLQRIDHPDGTARELFYEDTEFPGYMTRRELVGTDGTSRRVEAAWEYTATGRIARTWRGADTFASGVETYEYTAYDDETAPTSVDLTDPFGNVATYTIGYDDASTKPRLEAVSGECPDCGGPDSQYEYTDTSHPLRPTAVIDGTGDRTEFTYTAEGMVDTRTDAAGVTGLTRTINFDYHGTFPALRVLEQWPSTDSGTRETSWVYDGTTGVLESMTITGDEDGYDAEPDGTPEGAFTLTTAYRNHNTAGQPGEIDPPGFGSTDVTTFTYDPDRNGLLVESRTDPLVGTTDFTYDGLNRRTTVTDPNNVVTETLYDPMDRVDEVTRGKGSGEDLVTDYTYNVFGDLDAIIHPRGNATVYEYDDAGRLEAVRRQADPGILAAGDERALYTLNSFGQRTREAQQVWDGATWQTKSATEYDYTSRCYLDRIVHNPDSGADEITEHDYDCDGNLTAVWDANHPSSSQTNPPTQVHVYDALDRLVELREPWTAGTDCRGASPSTTDCSITTYSYDIQDHLTSVTDAEGNTTTYKYSDRDLLTEEVSPVSGTTTHRYNDHGALVETNDARGIQVNRTVDPLDRVTFVDYPTEALDTTYAYDEAPTGCTSTSPVGRLESITRNGETIEYCYDVFGRTTRDGSLTYTYDGNGNRTSIAYPGGVIATYTYDLVGDRQETLTVDPGSGAQPIVSGATYHPNGPLNSVTLENGLEETRGFDQRYLPDDISVSDAAGPILHWEYTTDDVGNVTSIDTVSCEGAELALTGETVDTRRSYEHCDTISSGTGFTVAGPDGDVTFTAGNTVVLEDGFSVTGGSFVADTDSSLQAGAPVARSFTYKDTQYFLTAADGPWGELDWTYDEIGNRLTEDALDPEGNLLRDDDYVYPSNGTGNTPILDQVTLNATLGTRDYTWDAAGNLAQIDASGNIIDFTFDDASRMTTATRSAASETADFSYDGRSFLGSAAQTSGGSDTAEALYDSAGLLHQLVIVDQSTLTSASVRNHARGTRYLTSLQDASAPPETEGNDPISPTGDDPISPSGGGESTTYGTHYFFYLAGRPVAQLTIDDVGEETWLVFTTDHLGTPIFATDEVGGEVWEGGFEPFGRDFQEGTGSGASDGGVFLRMPGQWDSEVWADATMGADLFYNVHRWYESGTGRYGRRDPADSGAPNPEAYRYAVSNPARYSDALGLVVWLDPTLQPFLDCARGSTEFQEMWRWFIEDGEWSIQPRGAAPMKLHHGQTVPLNKPSGPPKCDEGGRIFVDDLANPAPTGVPPDHLTPEVRCEQVIENIVHEIAETWAFCEKGMKPATSAHSGSAHNFANEVDEPTAQEVCPSCSCTKILDRFGEQ